MHETPEFNKVLLNFIKDKGETTKNEILQGINSNNLSQLEQDLSVLMQMKVIKVEGYIVSKLE